MGIGVRLVASLSPLIGKQSAARFCCSTGGFGTMGRYVALRCRHRLMAKELHERIHADIRRRELSGIGVAKTVHQCAGYRKCIWSCMLERALDARLQPATRYRSPSRPTKSGAVSGHPDSEGTGRRDCPYMYRSPPPKRTSIGTWRSLRPLSSTLITAEPSSSVRTFPTLTTQSSSARSPARSAVRIRARSLSFQSVLRASDSCVTADSSASTAVRGSAFGSGFFNFGRPTSCMGDWPPIVGLYRERCTTHSMWTSSAGSRQLRDRRQMPRALHASNASYVSWSESFGIAVCGGAAPPC